MIRAYPLNITQRCRIGRSPDEVLERRLGIYFAVVLTEDHPEIQAGTLLFNFGPWGSGTEYYQTYPQEMIYIEPNKK